MPLPSIGKYGAVQCKAKSKRSKVRCLNPAAYGMGVCRFHGARHSHTVLKGESHPNYRHGEETLEAKQARSEALNRIRVLEDLMHLLGMTTAKKTAGRKPLRD